MPALVFAHGAGAGQSHPFMQAWRARLETLAPVHAFEYDYMAAGRRAPQRLPKLLAQHALALAAARATHGDPVVLIGKSMGGRVGCHLAVQDPSVAGVVCLGYPLRTRAGKLRDAVLRELRVPVLFVQGTRDRMAPLDLLDAVRADMRVYSLVHRVDDGDHALKVAKRTLKRTDTTQDDHDAAAFDAVRAFVRERLL